MCEHEIVGVFSRFNVIIKSPLLLLCKPPLKVALVWNRFLLSGPESPGKNPQQGGQTFFRGFPRPLQFILDLPRGLLQDGQPRNTYPWRYPGGILTRCRKAPQLAPPARLCFELLQKCLSSRSFLFFYHLKRVSGLKLSSKHTNYILIVPNIDWKVRMQK